MIVRELVTLIRFQMEKAGFINAENQTSKLKKALNSTSDAGERLGEGISAGLKKATADMSAFERAMYKVGAYRDKLGRWRAPTGQTLTQQQIINVKTKYDNGAISGIDQLRHALTQASKAAQMTSADFKRAFTEIMQAAGNTKNSLGQWQTASGKLVDTARLKAVANSIRRIGVDTNAVTNALVSAGAAKDKLGRWHASGKMIDTSAIKRLQEQLQSAIGVAVALDRSMDKMDAVGIRRSAAEVKSLGKALQDVAHIQQNVSGTRIKSVAAKPIPKGDRPQPINDGSTQHLQASIQGATNAAKNLKQVLGNIDGGGIKQATSVVDTFTQAMRRAGNYQDKLGRWHAPNGKFVSTREIDAFRGKLEQVQSDLQRVGQSGRSSVQTIASAMREAAAQAKSFDDALKSAGIHQDELGRWHAPSGRTISDARIGMLQRGYSRINGDSIERSFNNANVAIRRTGFSLRELMPISLMIQGGFMGVGQAIYQTFSNAIASIRQTATEMQNLDGRLRSVSTGDADRQQLFNELYNVSNRSRSGMADAGDMFYKLQNASVQTGMGRQENLDITETVGKALTVGGASTQEKQATILQLSQALGSGVLQGDELRSLNENASGLMTEIAKYFNTTVGGLREMGRNGELTSEQVAKAILASKKSIDEQFEKMPYTIDNASTEISNFFKKMVRDFESSTGTFNAIARMMVAPVHWMQRAFDGLSKAVGGPQQAFRLLGVVMMALPTAAVVMNISKLAGAIGTISKAMRAFMLANGAAMAEFLVIAAAIALVALALQDVYIWIQGGDSLIGDYLGSFEEFKKQDWVQSLINGFQVVYDYATQFFNFIKTAIGGINWGDFFASFSWMLPILGSIRDGFVTIIKLVGNFIMSLINGVGQIDFTPLFEALAPLAQTLLPLIVDWFKMMATVVSTVLKVAFDIIAAIILYTINIVVWLIVKFYEFMDSGNIVAEVIKAAFQFMIDTIARGIRFITALFSGNWSGAIDEVKGFFSDLLGFALDILGKIGSAIGTFVMDKISSAKKAVMDFLGWSDSQTSQAVSKANNIAVNLSVNNTNYGVVSSTEVSTDDNNISPNW